MGAIWLKKGVEASSAAAISRNVREVVEATLAEIERRGDVAIRELSIKFDKWDRQDSG